MFRSLRVPERLFSIAMWATSVVFAGFLIGLGGKIVGELPGVQKQLNLQDFIDPIERDQVRQKTDSLKTVERTITDQRERAAQLQLAASNSYAAQRESFDAWIATRSATTDPAQDVEVLSRTRELDTLKAAERRAERVVESLDEQSVLVTQARDSLQRLQNDLETSAKSRYDNAQFVLELKVFGIRLLITLPLLIIAGWVIARKRSSDYWPLYRGFVLFAVFAFFVELVPYLPSYGGYVRYSVGIVASIIAGAYIIRAMRRYLEQRQRVEQQSEAERRRSLPYEEALKRMDAGVCPGCERKIVTIATPATAQTTFCVHCGLRLYDQCGNCETRKNAFFPYCPNCGVSTANVTEAKTQAPTSASHQ